MHSWMMKISLALAMAFTLFAPPALADAADPATPAVHSFYATLLDCMKGGKTLGAQGRYDKLKPVVEQTFDLGTMIKYAVGPTWSTASADDQKALTDAFARMTIAQYAGNFASYDGEKFIVEPKADIRGADHYVKTSLVAKDQTVSFIYRMRQSGNDWKIIDILLEGSIS
ncbi:MAG: ABC transporter substrate-binding protein, partial [Rhizomicrobium sp.]